MIDVNLLLTAMSAFFGAVAGVGGFIMWLNSKFGRVYEKIEAHDKLDATRFAGIDLALMRLEMSLQDKGKLPFQV